MSDGAAGITIDIGPVSSERLDELLPVSSAFVVGSIPDPQPRAGAPGRGWLRRR